MSQLSSESAEVINSADNNTRCVRNPMRRIRAGRRKAQIRFRHSSAVPAFGGCRTGAS